MKNTKKGFTLVELLVVIAILAVLATVSIIGYTAFIDKANESNDKSLVVQLNTAVLREDEKKYENMHEVAETLKAQGFDVAKMQATAKDHAILWDMEAQEFFYVEDGDRAAVTSWIVSDTVTVDDKYSTYYVGADNATINTAMGFDAGEAVGLIVNYTNLGEAQSVIIRTNDDFGTLTINAPEDEVEHYGAIGDLNVVAVKRGSYTEYGAVNGVATLTYGKINVAGEGKISVLIANPANKEDVLLDVASGGQVGAVFAAAADIVTALNVTGVKNAEVVEAGVLEGLDEKVCFVKNESGNVYYDDIQAAIDAATAETTIVLLKSVRYDNVTATAININAGKKIILDLNGNVIEAKLDNTKSVNLIKVSGSTGGEDVYAELTVKDSSAGTDGIGDGELRTTELYNSDPMNVSASVISVNRNGKVVIESGKVINNNTNCAWGAYAIDVLTNTGAQNAWLTVNGGLVESNTYRAIRAFCNSETGTAYITVNGGIVRSNGNNAIWMQDSSATKNNVGVLTIAGGVIESTNTSKPVYIWTQGEFDITTDITGGTFKSNGAVVTGEDIFRR